MRLRILVVLLLGLVFAPAAQAASAPSDLHAFLLRANEPRDPIPTFARTPSFSWDPVKGAGRYEFQLSTSRNFTENAIVWESDSLFSPVTDIPLTLPWITGNPYSLYARVRALVGGDATAWSARYGFRIKSPPAPLSLSSGANPKPGMVRWTPVDGATGYEVSFLYNLAEGKSKKIKTATTAADLREFYTFTNNLAAWGGTDISWRVRALRRLAGKAQNHLPAVSYGPWSPTFVTTEPPTIASAPIDLGSSISRSGSSDVENTIASAGNQAHELVPAFWWTGRYALDGSGDCSAAVQALNPNITCPLYHVYVFTDEDCVNRVHVSDLVGSPAYVPRTSRPLALPGGPSGLAAAPSLFLGDADKEGDVFDAGGERVFAAGTQDGIPKDADDENLPQGATPDRKSGIWDNDWPESRYYWTVVPAVPFITADNKVEYHDVEFAEDACQAGRVITFGKTSAPVTEKASGVPYLSGMTGAGEIRGATSATPSFFGRVVVAWKPAPGAVRYQVQWSKKANPFKAAGTLTTRATADILNLEAGVWYYRVRGVDGTLPTSQRGMTWSDPQYLKIVPRTFSVIRHRPL